MRNITQMNQMSSNMRSWNHVIHGFPAHASSMTIPVSQVGEFSFSFCIVGRGGITHWSNKQSAIRNQTSNCYSIRNNQCHSVQMNIKKSFKIFYRGLGARILFRQNNNMYQLMILCPKKSESSVCISDFPKHAVISLKVTKQTNPLYWFIGRNQIEMKLNNFKCTIALYLLPEAWFS